MIGEAVLGGFVLDTLFGDPPWLPHPVVLMGKAISALEKRLRARLPQTPQGELLGGAVVAFTLPVGTFLLTSLVCLGAAKLSPWLGLAVQMFWCGQALAAKGLAQESTNVYRALIKPDLPAARKAVSRIVGRDTQTLTLEGVTKAAVETVAENASAGVIAGTDLQGHQHDGQYAGLQKREVPLLWPRRRKTRRCGELSAQPVGWAALVRRCGPDREQPEGRMAHLAAGPALPRQPQQRPDRECLCRGAGRPVGRARLLFRRVLRKTYHRRPAPAH